MRMSGVDRSRHLLIGGANTVTSPSSRRLSPNFFDDAQPFKIEGVYCRLIPLTKGQFALVWESDYWELVRSKWYAKWNSHTRSYYAWRWSPFAEGRREHISMGRQLKGLKEWDGRKADHENHDTLDNRGSNLRDASDPQNRFNRRKNVNNSSGFKGVTLHSQCGRWRARIGLNGSKRSLGLFATREEAYAAYCFAAQRLHGEFANLG